MKISIAYRDLKFGIRNLIRWLPIVWRDRDWDKEYLYEIVHKKLENMEQYFDRDKAIIVESKEVAAEIREAKDALNRYIWNEKWVYVPVINNLKESSSDVHKDLERAFEIIAEKSQGWWD